MNQDSFFFHKTYLLLYLPTEKGLGAMLRESFVIGAESQSVMLRWAVRILSVHEIEQGKVQAEIDHVIGQERDVSWEDAQNLPYTRAALAEIQRLADIAPTAVAHKTMFDVEFHGYHLPKVRYIQAIMGNLKLFVHQIFRPFEIPV